MNLKRYQIDDFDMRRDILIAMKIVIATNNKHKLAEYKALFLHSRIEVLSMQEAGISADADEIGTSYEENAIIKAQSIQHLTNNLVIADDSGLEIASLNNFPGLISARFASEHGGNTQANDEILNRMKGVKDRSAKFIAVIALINYKTEPIVFRGECPGMILNCPQGSDGFGYDPIFYSIEAKSGFAVLSKSEKNRYSHRGKAVSKLLSFLKAEKLI
ncbi:MAG: RdgB/HAM1 family non-canonical purine NTP pyrophosphatase [Methanomicrobia archaeon]|nr:RdgB/HAM1 family non-canonical purine NTP pyrophosphatase [Methanomicrobia archaeon]